jgi:hypothetical protein
VSLTSQKAIAIRENFERPRTANCFHAVDLLTDNRQNQLGAIHPGMLNYPFAFSKGKKFWHGQSIQIIKSIQINLAFFGFAGKTSASGRWLALAFIALGDGHGKSSKLKGKMMKRAISENRSRNEKR